jgi:hypothetical protein
MKSIRLLSLKVNRVKSKKLLISLDGRITETGSYSQLMENDQAFARFIEECKNESEVKQDEAEDDNVEAAVEGEYDDCD